MFLAAILDDMVDINLPSNMATKNQTHVYLAKHSLCRLKLWKNNIKIAFCFVLWFENKICF